MVCVGSMIRDNLDENDKETLLIHIEREVEFIEDAHYDKLYSTANNNSNKSMKMVSTIKDKYFHNVDAETTKELLKGYEEKFYALLTTD